jgi:hypothetical protein
MQADMKIPHHVHASHTKQKKRTYRLISFCGWLPDSDSGSGCSWRRMFSPLGKAIATSRRHHPGKNAGVLNVNFKLAWRRGCIRVCGIHVPGSSGRGEGHRELIDFLFEPPSTEVPYGQQYDHEGELQEVCNVYKWPTGPSRPVPSFLPGSPSFSPTPSGRLSFQPLVVAVVLRLETHGEAGR